MESGMVMVIVGGGCGREQFYASSYGDQSVSRKDHVHWESGKKILGVLFADSTCARSKNSMSQLDSFFKLKLDKQNKEFTPGYHHSPLGLLGAWTLKAERAM